MGSWYKMFFVVGNKQMSWKVMGVRGQSVTGGSSSGPGSWGKPFRGMLLSWDLREQESKLMAHAKACGGMLKGLGVDKKAQEAVVEFICRRVETGHRGSKHQPEHEGLWGYANSFRFKSGQWCDVVEVINGTTQAHWRTDHRWTRGKTTTPKYQKCWWPHLIYHECSLKPDLGIYAKIRSFSTRISATGMTEWQEAL